MKPLEGDSAAPRRPTMKDASTDSAVVVDDDAMMQSSLGPCFKDGLAKMDRGADETCSRCGDFMVLVESCNGFDGGVVVLSQTAFYENKIRFSFLVKVSLLLHECVVHGEQTRP